MGLGTILSIGGAALGAFGKGKNKGGASVSGYASLPPELQTFLLKTVFPNAQKWFNAGYQGIPNRRMDASETDPIFGSKARMYYDAQIQKAAQKQAASGVNGGISLVDLIKSGGK